MHVYVEGEFLYNIMTSNPAVRTSQSFASSHGLVNTNHARREQSIVRVHHGQNQLRNFFDTHYKEIRFKFTTHHYKLLRIYFGFQNGDES